MPTTDQNGESKPESAWPGHELSCCSADGTPADAGGRRCELGDLVLEALHAADAVQADEGQRQQRGHDDEELEHLVVDRRRETAERDVGQHDRGRDEQRHPERPAEQRVHDRAEQVEVDAGDEQLREGEADRVDEVGARAEAAEHELRDRAHLRAVVEGHHHDAEEEHGGDRPDPEVVHGRDAELGTVGGHAHDLDGTEVRRDEGEAGDPGRQRPAGEEEVDGVGHRSPCHDPDAEDEDEVEGDDDVVDGIGVDEGACGGQTRQSVHAISPFVGRRFTLAQGPAPGASG